MRHTPTAGTRRVVRREVAATFRNRIALFLWGFAAVWLTALVAMTYVVLRDGPPAGSSLPTTALIVCAFWIFGIGLAAYVSTQPCIFVTVDPGHTVTATWRYPHKVVRKVLFTMSVEPAAIVISEDSEGGSYYYARVSSNDGESIDIAEGHRRADCERACARFNAALQRRSADKR